MKRRNRRLIGLLRSYSIDEIDRVPIDFDDCYSGESLVSRRPGKRQRHKGRESESGEARHDH
jgi:hypothetical protein